MGLYSDYLSEIETRKTQGLNPKPIEDGALVEELVGHIKDAASEHRKDCLNFFIYNTLPGTTSAAGAKAKFLKEIVLGNAVVEEISQDFALELTYLRNLTGHDLVESTMRELTRTGGTLPVRGKLEGCFRDVRKGDRFVAVSNGQDQIGFWYNGQRVCTLTHPQIKSRFMAIFLGDNTRSKSFTRQLKGE